jgi:hypothetical protein
MKVGDLVRFDNINGHTTYINRKTAVYLGKSGATWRVDGQVVENHKVLLLGETKPTTIDARLLRYMKVINENR